MSVGLSYKEDPEVVAKIDQVVISRRIKNPSATFTRAQLLREAVAAYLGDLRTSSVKTRTRARSNAA